jgi:Fic family protein
MSWFIRCLDRAIQAAEGILDGVLAKTRFWDAIPDGVVNERQRLVLNKLLDGIDGELTTRKWAAIAKCSHDTALRDIQDLIQKRLLIEGEAGGRSTHYLLRPW